MASKRSYDDAIAALNSLQSNAATLDAIRASRSYHDPAIRAETVGFVERLGYQLSDLNALNCVHIAGTKGKGSTASFTSSLLRSVAPNATLGLYTSPHLVSVRERIRLNGEPISEELFTKYFWEVWDRLGNNPPAAGEAIRPAYFRFLTILAYHAFLSEHVDATVLEVGIGGLLDATNVVPAPIATGITALGIDHVAVLGNTLPEITAHKAGIFKKGVPAFSVTQPPVALPVITRCAERTQVRHGSTV